MSSPPSDPPTAVQRLTELVGTHAVCLLGSSEHGIGWGCLCGAIEWGYTSGSSASSAAAEHIANPAGTESPANRPHPEPTDERREAP